jgi:hypothetical protein
MMTLGLLLILSVLYLPGGLASLRWDTWKLWRDDVKSWWRERRYEWSGEKARDKAVFIRADGRAPYQAVARVMARLSASGFTKLNLITDTAADEPTEG